MNATIEQTAQFAVRRAMPLAHHTGVERRGLGHRRILKAPAVINQISRFAHLGQAS